jgi:hypothetical protein
LLAGALLTLHTGCGDDDDGDGGTSTKPDATLNARDGSDDSDAGRTDASMTARVSYARNVKPIFSLHCTTCHRSGSIIDLDLTNPFDPEHGIINRVNSWATVHESKFETVVKPGAPDDSFLIYKVSQDPDPAKFDLANNGDPMPMMIPRVTAPELADIKQWIADGAKNDTFFTDKVAPIFGTQISLGGKRGKCTFCHYPESPTGLNVLDVFNSDTGLVDADSISSTKKRVAPGSPDTSYLVEKVESAMPKGGAQMPLHYPRLTAAEVDTLRTWIELGAKND